MIINSAPLTIWLLTSFQIYMKHDSKGASPLLPYSLKLPSVKIFNNQLHLCILKIIIILKHSILLISMPMHKVHLEFFIFKRVIGSLKVLKIKITHCTVSMMKLSTYKNLDTDL